MSVRTSHPLHVVGASIFDDASGTNAAVQALARP